MAGILFLIELAVFAVVVRWAYQRRGPDGPGPDTGLLAMRRVEDEVSRPRRRSGINPTQPRWRRTGVRPPQPPPQA